MKTPDIQPHYEHIRLMTRIGWGLFVVWATVLIAAAIWKPDPYAQGWRLVLELAFLGRLVSTADGVQLGFDNAYLMFQNGLQDIIVTLIFLPLALKAYHGDLEHKRWFGRTIASVRANAEANKHIIEPFGVVGLWVFVFFPFWSTGVLVGSFVGFLIGMRLHVILTSVITGHVLSCIAMIWLSRQMNEAADAIGIGKYLVWVLIAMLLAATYTYNHFFNRAKQRRQHADNQPADTQTSDDDSPTSE